MRKFGIGLAVLTLIFGSFLAVASKRVEANAAVTPSVVGERAIVIDADTGTILFERNADERAAPASLTKLFTALFAIQDTPLQRRMSVAKDDLVGEASAGLRPGENLSFETLLHGLMLASGNDSAMTIARNVGSSQSPSELEGVSSFIEEANDRIAELGLRNTNLVNPHGLDEPGHYSSASDIAALTMYALKTEPDFLAAISSPGYIAEGHHFPQTNRLMELYPGAIGGKTGITDAAGFSLMGIAHRDGRTLISVVMGSTPEAWYTDVMTLFDVGFATLATPGATSGSRVIELASAESMNAPVSQPVASGNFQTYADGMNVASVRTISNAEATSWTVWRWPVGATLAMLVVLVCAVQTRACIALRKRPLAGTWRPRSMRTVPHRADHTGHRHHETQPFATVGSWEPSASNYPVWSGSLGD